MVHAIYIDESGYTGRALLDPAQPLFCVASSLIGDEEAEEILRRAFPTFGGEEFKLQQLWRRDSTRRQIIDFARELPLLQERLFLWTIDKRFCVLTKLIDFLVEPIAHQAGRDFYKNGHAIRYANYVHYGLELEGTPELYEATLRPYYEFARDPTEERLRVLQFSLQLMANSAPEPLRFFYQTAALGAELFHRFHDMATFRDSFEVQLTSVFGTVGYWRNRLPDELELFHDASGNFFGQKELWDAITADGVPEQLHPVANSEPLPFPLRVRATHAVDSRDSYAIQLADVLAGIAVRIVTDGGSANAELVRAILENGFGELTFNGIRPEPQFPEGPPEPLDGPDAVDQMLAIIRPPGAG